MKIYEVKNPEGRKSWDRMSRNHLQQRMGQLAQILMKNNVEFSKGLPSEQQLKKLLDHSFNCYDQLDFISLQQSKNDIVFLSPKGLAEQMHRIMRASKNLISNIKSWVDTYSLELLKRVTEEKVKQYDNHNFTNVCRMCQKNLEEVVLKDAKKQILGPDNWRELFDEELFLQKQEEEENEETVGDSEGKQYVSSVNYLCKVIKEMQASAERYQTLAERVDKEQDFQEEDVVKLLDEVLGKLKAKLGESYKVKQKNIVNKLLRKVSKSTVGSINSEHFMVSQQFDLIIGEPPKKQRVKKNTIDAGPSKEELVEQLMEQNKRLLIERNSINELYASSQSVLNELTGYRRVSGFYKKSSVLSSQGSKNNTVNLQNSVIEGNNENKAELNAQKGEKIVYRERIHQVAMVDSSNHKKAMKESMIKRLSMFNMKKIQSRRSELKEMFDTTNEKDVNDYDWQKYFNTLEASSGNAQNQEHPDGLKKDVGCQWDLMDLDLEEAINRKSSSKSKKGNRRPTICIEQTQFSSDEAEEDAPLMFRDEGRSKKSLNSKSNRSISQKKTQKSKMKNIGRKAQQRFQTESKKQLHGKQAETFHEGLKKQSKKKKEDILQKSIYASGNAKENKIVLNKKVNRKLDKIESRKEGKAQSKKQNQTVSLDKIDTGKERENKQIKARNTLDNKQRQTLGTLMKTLRFEVEDERYAPEAVNKIDTNSNFPDKGSRKQLTKHRLATEGNERVLLKKNKTVVNFLFKPMHLSIFGGVSESYAYQNQKCDFNEQLLTESDKNLLSRLVLYLCNLKGFKRSIYQNTVFFLSHPFSAIQQGEFEFHPVSEEKLRKIAMKLLLLHKQKCGSLECEHTRMLFELIGFVLG